MVPPAGISAEEWHSLNLRTALNEKKTSPRNLLGPWILPFFVGGISQVWSGHMSRDMVIGQFVNGGGGIIRAENGPILYEKVTFRPILA